ncbi:aldo/keto reductase [bacterium]|nr:aldo/keto reductase [bacterium]
MESFVLKSGAQLPAVGLGLWKIDRSHAADVVVSAVKTGYRHFDAASDYGNEAEVGEGLSHALQQGLVKREDLWITSKLWNTYHRAEHVRPALLRTLLDLRLDSLDLYLMHFPIALKYVPFEERYPAGWIHDPASPSPRMEPDPVPLLETWQAMEELVAEGLVQDIGVCNFGVALLRDLLAAAKIAPAVLQIEAHPYLTQEKLLRFCREAGIVVTAFSPLGAQSYFSLNMANAAEAVLEHPSVKKIAATHGRTPAQVVLRWGVQRGTAVVPKTMNPARLSENLSLFDFQLNEQEMVAISALNCHRRFNDPGVFCEAAFHTFFPIYE